MIKGIPWWLEPANHPLAYVDFTAVRNVRYTRTRAPAILLDILQLFEKLLNHTAELLFSFTTAYRFVTMAEPPTPSTFTTQCERFCLQLRSFIHYYLVR